LTTNVRFQRRQGEGIDPGILPESLEIKLLLLFFRYWILQRLILFINTNLEWHNLHSIFISLGTSLSVRNYCGCAGVTFINISLATFLYERALFSFYLITVWLCYFWEKEYQSKTARKMLMKLTAVCGQDVGHLHAVAKYSPSTHTDQVYRRFGHGSMASSSH